MRWPDSATPARMQRVALVAPSAALRDVLAQVADAAVMQIDQDADRLGAAPPRVVPQARTGTSRGLAAQQAALIAAAAPDVAELERSGRADLLAGEAELAAKTAAALRRSDAAALTGWIPVSKLPEVTTAWPGRAAPSCRCRGQPGRRLRHCWPSAACTTS